MDECKPPWFKMDAAKFLQDRLVDEMTTLELGAAIRLLCRQWIDGYLPNDIRSLARLCRLDPEVMAEAWRTLAPWFPEIEPGKRANRYMWVEREIVVADLIRKSDQGRKAVRVRWDKVQNQHVNTDGIPSVLLNQGGSNTDGIRTVIQDKIRLDKNKEEIPSNTDRMRIASQEKKPQESKTPPSSKSEDQNLAKKVTAKGIPYDMDIHSIARWMFDGEGAPLRSWSQNPRTSAIVVDAIKAAVRVTELPLAEAATFLVERIEQEQTKTGKPIKFFWLEDGQWDERVKPAAKPEFGPAEIIDRQRAGIWD